MPTYNVMRSYTITEMHLVEAANMEEAIELVDKGDIDYFVKSYDGDYHRNQNGEIQYNVEEN